MLTRSFHNALHEVKTLGISTDEAIKRHREFMTLKEEEILRSMEDKTMKKATRRTHGNGNNARVSNITSVSYAKGLRIESMRKAPKVSVCKVFKLGKDGKVYRFEITEERATICGAMKVDTETVRVIHSEECGIERARDAYKALIAKGYKPCNSKEESKKPSKKQTSKKSKKTDSKKASKETKKESTKKASKKETKKDTTKKPSTKKPSKVGVKETAKRFELRKGNTTYRFTVTKNRGILVRWNGNYRYCRTEEARWMYRNLLNDGYKRVA